MPEPANQSPPSNIPPPPPGYTLDAAAGTPSGGVPPPPSGYTLDKSPQPSDPSAYQRYTGSLTESFGLPSDIRQWPEALSHLADSPFGPKAAGTVNIGGVETPYHLPEKSLLNVPANMLKGVVSASKAASAGGWNQMQQPGAVNKVAGATRYIVGGLPIVGPALVRAMDQADEGDYAGMFGTLSGVGLQALMANPEATASRLTATGQYLFSKPRVQEIVLADEAARMLKKTEASARAEAHAKYPDTTQTVPAATLSAIGDKAVSDNITGTPSVPTPIKSMMAEDVIKRYGGMETPGGSLLDLFTKVRPDTPISMRDVQGYRSELGQLMAKGNLPGDTYAAVKQAHGEISDLLQKVFESEGKGPQFEDADRNWQNLAQVFYNTKDSPVARALDEAQVRQPLAPEATSLLKHLSGDNSELARRSLTQFARHGGDPDIVAAANTLYKGMNQLQFRGLYRAAGPLLLATYIARAEGVPYSASMGALAPFVLGKLGMGWWNTRPSLTKLLAGEPPTVPGEGWIPRSSLIQGSRYPFPGAGGAGGGGGQPNPSGGPGPTSGPASPYPGIQPARTATGKLQLGADAGALADILGSNLYEHRGPGIVAKELLQNAFDAVRPRGEGGKIQIYLHPAEGKFQVVDNGIGMTPNQVFTVFSDLGASGKRADVSASGGFGVAKAAPFMIADKLEVVTTAVDPTTGKMVQTSFTSTPADIKAGNVEVQSKDVNYSTPTGTSITAHVGTDNFYSVRQFANSTLRSVNPPGAIEVRDMSFRQPENQLMRPPEDQLDTPVGSLSIPSATMNMYKASKRSGGISEMGIPIEIHNNGIYQFETTHYPSENERYYNLPTRVAVDIHPKIAEGQAGYPFTPSRERLNADVDNAVKQMFRTYILDPEREGTNKFLADKYNNMPTMEVGHDPTDPYYGKLPIFDSGGRLTPQEVNVITSDPLIKSIGEAINLVAHNIIGAASEEVPTTLVGRQVMHGSGGIGGGVAPVGSGIDRVGLLMSKEAHGLYIPDPSNPSRGSIFINPYSFHGFTGENAGKAASSLLHTIIHEIAHDVAKGHNETFTQTLHVIDQYVPFEVKADMHNLLREALSGGGTNVIHPGFSPTLRLYEESRARPATERDVLGGQK